ncbi:EamA family transporter [Tellurirhabdus bombi]|uniref:EamA family transporter n=1 Tax=Tellurirhabdus bombi TaxID=2907205 RepID=UPI001F3F1C14|nr:EamA family transporter [Tellurirhabdus bombi]
MWFVFSLLAALSAAVVVTLSKVGIRNVDSTVGFAIQSVLILLVSWGIVIGQGNLSQLSRIDRRSWIFLIIAGVITCLSSVFSFRALKLGDASRAGSLDKVSLVFIIILAAVFLKEKLNWQVIVGGLMMGAGAIVIALARDTGN